MNPPRVHALVMFAPGFWKWGGPVMHRDELGGGGYHYLSCGTADEQSGCVLDPFARNVPSNKWISIEQLGMNWRMAHN